MMRLKQFESELQSVEGFARGDVTLEQYMTPPRIAAQMISVIQSQYADISERLVCDLGAGTGMLTIASIMYGATHVTAVDCDRQALVTLIRNAETCDIDRASFDVVCQDVHDMRNWQQDESDNQITIIPASKSAERRSKRSFPSVRARPSDRRRTNAQNKSKSKRKESDDEEDNGDEARSDDDDDGNINQRLSQTNLNAKTLSPIQIPPTSPPNSDVISTPLYSSLTAPRLFDTVICNPPFGTRHTGIDMTFVHAALQLTDGAVYSLHKSSTRDYIQSTCRQWQVNCDVLYQIDYPLSATYHFHKEKNKVIAVDLIRFYFIKDNPIPTRFRSRMKTVKNNMNESASINSI